MKPTYLCLFISLICIMGMSAQNTPRLNLKLNSQGLIAMEMPDNNSCIFIGLQAGHNNMYGGPMDNSGKGNTFVGNQAGMAMTSGMDNTYIGLQAGSDNVSGSSNVVIGSMAQAGVSGNNNVMVGSLSGSNTLNGNNNTMIGYQSGHNASGSGNVFIGNQVGKDENISNTLIIDNQTVTSGQALIFGDFNSDDLRFNAHVDVYSNDASQHGINVIKNHSEYSDLPAVRGQNTVHDYFGIGISGVGGWKGVEGSVAPIGNGSYFGSSGSCIGGYGTNYGIYGTASGGSVNYGVYGHTSSIGPNSFAGYFSGKVKTTDLMILSANGISFSDTDPSGSKDDDDVINKTVAIRYFISTFGSMPSDAGGTPVDGILIGEIKLMPYSIIPDGWLPCEGQLLDINAYPSLFSLLGTDYGGDGVSTFGIPDMRNAIPNHKG